MISHPLIECSRGREEIASASAVQLFAARKWSTNQTPKLFLKVICLAWTWVKNKCSSFSETQQHVVSAKCHVLTVSAVSEFTKVSCCWQMYDNFTFCAVSNCKNPKMCLKFAAERCAQSSDDLNFAPVWCWLLEVQPFRYKLHCM